MRMKKDNVERVVNSQIQEAKLKREGFREIGDIPETKTIPEETVVCMEDLTREELKKIAREKGLEGYSGLTKEELRLALKGVSSD